MWIIYAITLIDRFDGYISIFSILIFIAFFFINDLNRYYTHSVVSIIFIASMLVFSKHNFSRRQKLFVGEAGSLFIGFWIANFLILFITSSNVSNITNVFSIQLENIPILAIASINIPLIDFCRIFLIKIFDKNNEYSYKNIQIQHILINKNISHFNTSLVLCLINTFNLILIFLLEPYFHSFGMTIVYFFVSLFWLGFFEYLKRN